MAKRQTKQPQARYRLTDLRISKVSLVDEPAVPKAVFVIAKRREDEAHTVVSTPVTPPENTDENAQDAISKRLDTVCEKLDSLTTALAGVVEKLTQPVVVEKAAPAVPEPAPKPSRITKHVALLARLDKRINGAETLLRNVTGELPPDEE